MDCLFLQKYIPIHFYVFLFFFYLLRKEISSRVCYLVVGQGFRIWVLVSFENKYIQSTSSQYFVLVDFVLVVGVKFKCPNCTKEYWRKSTIARHMKYECGKEPMFGCSKCIYRGYQKIHVIKHFFRKHPGCPDLKVVNFNA